MFWEIRLSLLWEFVATWVFHVWACYVVCWVHLYLLAWGVSCFKKLVYIISWFNGNDLVLILLYYHRHYPFRMWCFGSPEEFGELWKLNWCRDTFYLNVSHVLSLPFGGSVKALVEEEWRNLVPHPNAPKTSRTGPGFDADVVYPELSILAFSSRQ